MSVFIKAAPNRRGKEGRARHNCRLRGVSRGPLTGPQRPRGSVSGTLKNTLKRDMAVRDQPGLERPVCHEGSHGARGDARNWGELGPAAAGHQTAWGRSVADQLWVEKQAGCCRPQAATASSVGIPAQLGAGGASEHTGIFLIPSPRETKNGAHSVQTKAKLPGPWC